MSTITRNRANSVKHLEFELLRNATISFHYTFECRMSEANSCLMYLYYHAQNIFERTSNIFTLRNDECTIKGESDLLSDLKLHAQMLVLSERRIAAVSPLAMRAFACETPVGEVAYFGFAQYVENIVLDRTTHRLHDGKKAYWKGFVRVAPRDYERNDVLRTVDSFTRFMRLAEQKNLLREFVMI